MALEKQKKIVSWLMSAVFLLMGIFLPFKTVLASMTIYESYIATQSPKIELIGAIPGEQFGAAVISGDLNGDGIEDLIVSSPFASSPNKEWNGSVSVIFGQKKLKSSVINLAKTPPSLLFYGETSGDSLGTSLAAGDFNGDGIDDLAIGAYNAFYKNYRPGKVYLIYGRSSWNISIYDFSISPPDVSFMGYSNKDEFGLSLLTLDISNDGVDDLLIGAPGASCPDTKNSGNVYAFFGDSGGFPSTNYDSKNTPSDIVFYGHAKGERFGSAIAGGHIISNDKYDLAIGAYMADAHTIEQAGKVYFYKGSSRPFTRVKSYTSVIEGTASRAWFGFSIAVGDLGEDGWDDLLISSFPYAKQENISHVSGFYGGSRFSRKGWTFKDEENYRNIFVGDSDVEILMGSSLLIDDFNSDGKGDIAIGAPSIGNPVSDEPGNTYLLYSGSGEYKENYSIKNQTMTAAIHGQNADDWFGNSVGSIDFNGDGYKDLIVGSRYSDGSNSNDNGKVFVLFGYNVPFGKAKSVIAPEEHYLTRSELTAKVIEKFKIKEKKADYIASCYKYKEFCFFNFLAMSKYEGIQLSPKLLLYPDVTPENKYYDDVSIGTMLSLVNGFMNETNSPFYPDKPISRIQALKVVLGASELVAPKYRFELIKELGSYENLINQPSLFDDINAKISSMWWYPRYANFAAENGIIENGKYFRPDDYITLGEFESLIGNTLEYLKNSGKDAQIEP